MRAADAMHNFEEALVSRGVTTQRQWGVNRRGAEETALADIDGGILYFGGGYIRLRVGYEDGLLHPAVGEDSPAQKRMLAAWDDLADARAAFEADIREIIGGDDDAVQP